MGNKPCSGLAIAILIISIVSIAPSFGGSLANMSGLLVLIGAIWTMIATQNQNHGSAVAASWFTFIVSLISLITIVAILTIAIIFINKLPDNRTLSPSAALQSPFSLNDKVVEKYQQAEVPDGIAIVKSTTVTLLAVFLGMNIIVFLALIILSWKSKVCHAKLDKLVKLA